MIICRQFLPQMTEGSIITRDNLRKLALGVGTEKTANWTCEERNGKDAFGFLTKRG